MHSHQPEYFLWKLHNLPERKGFLAKTRWLRGGGVVRVVANDEESYQYLVESIRKFPRQEVLADMMINVNLSCVGYENLSGGIVAIHSAFKA